MTGVVGIEKRRFVQLSLPDKFAIGGLFTLASEVAGVLQFAEHFIDFVPPSAALEVDQVLDMNAPVVWLAQEVGNQAERFPSEGGVFDGVVIDDAKGPLFVCADGAHGNRTLVLWILHEKCGKVRPGAIVVGSREAPGLSAGKGQLQEQQAASRLCVFLATITV